MEEMKSTVSKYVSRIHALASELDVTPEEVIAALTLRQLEAISSQLFNQGYHRGYEVPLDERLATPALAPEPVPRWQSPASSQAAVVD